MLQKSKHSIAKSQCFFSQLNSDTHTQRETIEKQRTAWIPVFEKENPRLS